MVLTLKRWKSRSSPGIEAGALRDNPFTISKKPLPVDPSGGFLVSGGHAGRPDIAIFEVRQGTSQGRLAARTAEQSEGGRKARVAQAAFGA